MAKTVKRPKVSNRKAPASPKKMPVTQVVNRRQRIIINP